ncbi:MAG: HAMP domain-containing sensor histidine kinase [Bacillota bacterium]|nr:HAMP domain-containing sensor histidine kinase [Bacillota bacterium]
MSTEIRKKKRNKLSSEILGILGGSAVIGLFFFKLFNLTAASIVFTYYSDRGIVPDEIQQGIMETWISSLSLTASVIIFIVLFLVLTGQRLSYLGKIIKGVEGLQENGMDLEVPLEWNNELTELAEKINYLSKTERELKRREEKLRNDRELLIRSLSHDIRTPLTGIMSYTEYISEKQNPDREEISSYLDLVQKKSQQIKSLTDRLLDSSGRSPERIENGKLFMNQLLEEWAESLEEEFPNTSYEMSCPDFSGEFDIQEFIRIFDNLSSNIEKYADREKEIKAKVYKDEGFLIIEQTNTAIIPPEGTESRGIGIKSIEGIAANYDGKAEVKTEGNVFRIIISLKKIQWEE